MSVITKYKYNYVYKTTNIINNKIYIGVHSTNNLNDGYFGSGTYISKAIKKYGKENFINEIIKFFDTREECFKYESEIVTTDFIKNDNVYNITEGGRGVLTHSPEGLIQLSLKHKNTAVMKQPDGSALKVSIFDENFSSMVGYTKGMVCAKDVDGNEYFITQEQFENNNSLFGRTKGQITVIEKSSGNKILIDLLLFDRTIHQALSLGKITVKDKIGNTMQISINDPRYLSGELVGVMKGMKYKHRNKQKTLICPHCGKNGNASNMKRWHFSNCRFQT